VALDDAGLAPRVRELFRQIANATPQCEAHSERAPDLFTATGLTTAHVLKQVRVMANFVGEVTLGFVSLVRRPDKFRWRDCLAEMQHCGAMALPIISLIGLLVGLTLAYTAAVLLRQFGADIYVADFVGLVTVREMGPVMTAIVLAGRTGAAFAATIGNMKANEEIDALQTLGLRPVEFLALPRIIALALMTPLLALYANVLGMIGGMLVALGILEIPPTAYWVEMQTAVDLSDIGSGLVKAATFGVIVGLSGCLRGLQADRSAAGVGQAATSAVVTSILLIIVADALYAVIFNILGW
jgi:phospholipid/cholesterol/gamma-HCH transport system permease protein